LVGPGQTSIGWWLGRSRPPALPGRPPSPRPRPRPRPSPGRRPSPALPPRTPAGPTPPIDRTRPRALPAPPTPAPPRHPHATPPLPARDRRALHQRQRSQLVQQSRLADATFAADQPRATASAERVAQFSQQPLHLGIAANKTRCLQKALAGCAGFHRLSEINT